MITPAYSTTATERVLPRMALDFTTGVLDSRVTVTRALNTATAVNSSGLVAIVNANLPRFDYNPATLAPNGLLIEESRANLLTRSSELATAPWTTNQVTVSADATTSPDGTANADKVIPSIVSGAHNIYQSYVYTAVAHTLSVYAKAGGYNWIRLGSMFTGQGVFFDVANGVVGTVSAGYAGTITAAGNGWYRCTVTRTATAGADLAGFYVSNSGSTVSFAGDGTSGVFAWGAQLEIGAFATSYIPTTTTSLTRNADGVSMTGTNFSSWYNQSQGTLVLGGDVLRAPTGGVNFATLFFDYSNFIRIRCNSSSTPEGNITTGGSSVMGLSSGNISSNTPFKAALAYATNNSNFGLNGTNAATDTSVSLPSPNRLGIGSLEGASGFMAGHISFINYYPQRLLNAELAAFSK
jgi:hypothetical protein